MFKFSKSLFMIGLGLFILSAPAFGEEYYPPIKDELVLKECGACHMPFPSQMLPKQSWTKIMAGLSDHFGEDATLNAQKTADIKSYLEANAADSKWLDSKFMRGISETNPPLRITETPYWIRKHNSHEVPARAWNDPKVKSKANCVACHRLASSGNYDDD
jgi:hypothetical protein